MNKLLLCLLLLLCACSTEKTVDSSTSVEEITSTPISTILKEEDWQTVTTNGIEMQYSQFESLFLMEVDTKDLSEVKELEEFKDMSRLKVQYLLTSKKYGNLFVFDVTDEESALYGCKVKKNEIEDIEVYSLDVTEDPNRLIPLTNELFSIIQDIIVFNED